MYGLAYYDTMPTYSYAECYYAEYGNISLFVECTNAECHSAECHFVECHFAECHSAECHFAHRKRPDNLDHFMIVNIY
jgi:hypothetical protein